MPLKKLEKKEDNMEMAPGGPKKKAAPSKTPTKPEQKKDPKKGRQPKIERLPLPLDPKRQPKIERMPMDPSKKPKFEFLNKGGRVGLRAGSTGCKLAMKGKGRAYGKNS